MSEVASLEGRLETALNKWKVISQVADGRQKSFFYLHDAFKTQKENPDLVALYLFSFLGSWGMYRNSFLLQKSYRFLIKEIEILWEYNDLQDIDPFDGAFQSASYINRVLALKKELTDHLVGTEYIEEDPQTDVGLKQTKLESVTDTFLSKIMLGTLACVPALDSEVRSTLRQFDGFRYNEQIDKRGLKKLLAFMESQKDLLKDAQKKAEDIFKETIPMMKVFDFLLWV